MTIQIKSSEEICGIPALKARDLMRGADSLNVDNVSYFLECPKKKAKEILDALIATGYLAPVDKKGQAALTKQGESLARASAQGGYKRQTCERVFNEFLERVATYQSNPRLPYVITKVVLFGSMLGENPILGDVDVIVETGFRYDDDSIKTQLFAERRSVARQNGRELRTMIEDICWPGLELSKFLKNGKGLLKIQEWMGKSTEKFLSEIPHRYIEVPHPVIDPNCLKGSKIPGPLVKLQTRSRL